jgi:hypothetical protein
MEEISKTKKVLIAIFGGVDTVVYIMTPIILSLLFIRIMNVSTLGANIFQIVGLLATLFRGYKIGFIPK